ncbi:MAG: ADP-ribosylglycohydrolase family protein [Victivallales bacterium]|nr:ADP-ribosylglycohydrolase family protein [Victivallales bacterium]
MEESILRDKILGCFLGKNIGGTLGAPFECQTQMNDVDFFTRDPGGVPLPNDDLDLQLLWLTLAEYYGPANLTSRRFGEAWIDVVIGPWGEYSNCRWNCLTGFMPPLSGSCDNEGLKFRNGAWIRSEIWACLCAGRPDDAIRYAWLDASADHASEGIYAEMFTASLEASAFCVNDLRELLEIGLLRIPQESRLAQSIRLAMAGHDSGRPWRTVREEVVALNQDLGWFQAPANVAFMVIGLLYGEGDFGRAVCTAVNCGDDTDCTAATAGAIMGILLGAKGIPEKWRKPVGDGIATISLNKFSMTAEIPKTVTELTERIMLLRRQEILRDPALEVAQEDLHSQDVAQLLWKRSCLELRFDAPTLELGVEYLAGPYLTPGKPCTVRLNIRDSVTASQTVHFRWRLPDGWQADPNGFAVGSLNFCQSSAESTIIPPENLPEDMYYLNLEMRAGIRSFPTVFAIPFRRAGSFNVPFRFTFDEQSDGTRRFTALRNRVKELCKKISG